MTVRNSPLVFRSASEISLRAGQGAGVQRPQGQDGGRVKSLIIVEDEALIADMVRTMVEDIGWSVDGVAYSANGGHRLLDANRPAAAILDIDLGGSTSASLASVCHSRDIPIIYITGYSSDHVLEGPFVALLTKPFATGDLAEALAAAEALAVSHSLG
jgi:DNA-binding response OmpR family regulator